MTGEAAGGRRLPTLFGVSVGPGDPDLITLAAIRAIEAARVVCYPATFAGRRAAKVCEAYLANKDTLAFDLPMRAPADLREQAYASAAHAVKECLEAGLSVACLCLGDVSLYSSFHRLLAHLDASTFELVVVPGVTSMSAAAAALRMPLATAGERCLVLEATDALEDPDALTSPGTRVIMKLGHRLEPVLAELARRAPDATVAVAERVGLPGERLYPDAGGARDLSYLSLAIVREKEAPEET